MFDIDAIKSFFIKKHENQACGLYSYSHHLEHVFLIAQKYKLSLLIQAGSWGHDSKEDTDTTDEELFELTKSKEFVEIIECVTDEPGKNRKERKRKTYLKIRENADAIGLKLCDRIANVESCIIVENHSLFRMYLKEHSEFKEMLKIDDTYPKLWDHLEKLFKIGLKSLNRR